MKGEYQTVIRATRPWSEAGLSERDRNKKWLGDSTAPEREGRRARRRADGDSPEQIQMCLNCKLASCKNCVESSPTMRKALCSGFSEDELEPIPPKREKRPRGRPKKTESTQKTIKQQIRELMEQGDDERKIAWKLNADRSAVRRIMVKILEEEGND